jgi:hypothetical protein
MGLTSHIKENLTTFPHLMKWAAKIAEVSISVIPINEIAIEQTTASSQEGGNIGISELVTVGCSQPMKPHCVCFQC